MLLCPVRDCHLPLSRESKRFVCPRSHSFDIARSGYTNLLQPQDRRSKQPGDTTAAVAARRRLHDRGVSEPLLKAIAEMADARPRDIVLDAGCGDGFYLGSIARQTGFDLPAARIAPARSAARDLQPGFAAVSSCLVLTATAQEIQRRDYIIKPRGDYLMISNRTSRRFFLGAATAAATARVWGANDRINVAIVGIGGRGPKHLNVYLKLPNARVAGPFGLDPAAPAGAQATPLQYGSDKVKEV